LRAQKVNRTWKTTKEWVEEFEKKASERKKEIRKELSEKLGGEEKVIGGIGVIGRWRRNEFAKPAVALIALVLLIAMANITKADLGMMRDKAVVKFLTGYNFAVEKIASVAKPFEKIKIGSDAIKQINEAIVNRKRIQKFEEESKLSLTGGEEEKGEIAKEEKGAKEEGAVAGEESSVISEASPTSSAGYEAGKVTTQDVLGALDHDLTYEHIAEHKVRRWNLNKNSVNSKKIVDYSVEARDLSTNAVNSRSIENKSVHSRDLADDIRIRGNLTVNENAYFNQNVELVVLENDNVYSKAQAQQIVNKFFSSNPPESFTVIHQGGKEGAQYVIGNLVTGKGTYRVYFLLKKNGGKDYIHQLRIEAQ